MGNIANDHRFNNVFQYTYNKHLAYLLKNYVGSLSFAVSLHDEMA